MRKMKMMMKRKTVRRCLEPRGGWRSVAFERGSFVVEGLVFYLLRRP